jgi:hypothetical protein
MKLFFDNSKASATTGILIALVFSVLFTSIVISWFITEMQVGGNIEQIELPNSLRSYNSEQNFASGTYDLETLKRSGSSHWQFRENVGLVLTQTSGDVSYLYIDYIIPDGTHTVTNYYTINNSQHIPYSIVISNAGMASNEIMVKSDGFHMPAYGVTGLYNGWDMHFIPFNNPLQYDEVKIKTTYKEGLRECPLFDICRYTRYPVFNFEYNGISYIVPEDKINTPEFEAVNIYGGVAAQTAGIAVKDFKTDNTISGTEKITNDPLTYISSFLDTMFKLLTWGLPESIMPFYVNLILIKSQLFGILVCLVFLIRGV